MVHTSLGSLGMQVKQTAVGLVLVTAFLIVGIVVLNVTQLDTFLLEVENYDDTYAWVTIEIGQGKIQGRRVKPLHDVVEFYNLPYAEPPIGDLRFRAPRTENVVSWGEDTHDARNRGNRCLEKSKNIEATDDVYTFSEDCLYLNVATRNLRNTV